ncbi:hypothetical protein [Sulfitobacter sp. DSM 110093]|uniref:hypothetical protein n=1 Tax=Sulfitobacter sp. DSM 110093 TaxID=2883127 RepID=UPI001FAD4FA8|nr:hypothetical protein [Sulfitobacter sp. DSM 110093]
MKLEAGLTLLQAMTDAVDGAGAWFDLTDLPVSTLTFVRPAPATDDCHVAWYSAEKVLNDATILHAGAHLGRRDGAAFAHVHGLWVAADGARHAGHLLGEATVLSVDCEVDVWVLEGAVMETGPDVETGFTLFRPTQKGTVDCPNAVLATIRPNEILEESLAICASTSGLRVKAVKGLGSLIGAKLIGQPSLNDRATEVLLTGEAGRAVIAVGFNGPSVVGELQSSSLICVTFEALLLS